jgi:hypothetical protein
MHTWRTLAKHKGLHTPSPKSAFLLPFAIALAAGSLLKVAGCFPQGDWLVCKLYFRNVLTCVWLAKVCIGVAVAVHKTQWSLYAVDSIKDLQMTLACFVVVLLKEQLYVYSGFRLSGHLLSTMTASLLMQNEARRIERCFGVCWAHSASQVMWALHLTELVLTSAAAHSVVELWVSYLVGVCLVY